MQTNMIRGRRKYCSKCRRYGNHTDLLCNDKVLPICPFCASTEHSSITCPQRICTICRDPHLDKRCKVIPSQLSCSLCNMSGHSERTCTNNWRMFSNVTRVEELDKMAVPQYRKHGIACTMCGSRHHLHYTCSTLKNTPFYFNPALGQSEADLIKERAVRSAECYKTKVTNREDDEDAPGFVIDTAPNFELDQEAKTEPVESCSYTVDEDLRYSEDLGNDEGDQPSTSDGVSICREKLAKAMALVRKKHEAEQERLQRGRHIDENVRAVATQFNEINTRNVHQFQTADDRVNGYMSRKKQKFMERPGKKKPKFKLRPQSSYSNKIKSKFF